MQKIRISQVFLLEILNWVTLCLVRTKRQGSPFGEEEEFVSSLILVWHTAVRAVPGQVPRKQENDTRPQGS